MGNNREAYKKFPTVSLIFLIFLSILIVGCGGGGGDSSGGDETPTPTITSFVQTSGYAGDTVIITGTNFSATAASNIVKFNGTQANVASSTTTRIVAYVPSGAATGTISVAVGGITATSSASFTVNTKSPAFAGYYNDGAKDIPIYWTGIGVTTTPHVLAGNEVNSAYAYSTIVAPDGKKYTAGYYNNGTIDIACYWIDDNKNPIILDKNMASDNYAFSVTVSGGVIYISGFYYDSTTDRDVPCYWTVTNAVDDPVRTNLGDGINGDGYAFAIAAYNGTIYSGGYYYDSVDVPCYWATTGNTTTLHLLDHDTNSAEVFSIAVSGGTVYTAGNYSDDANAVNIPCYWTGATRSPLPDNNGYDAYASSIAIYDGKVYMSGFYNDGSHDIPCYWSGITRTPLEGGANNAEAFSIAVSGGTVYTAGIYDNGTIKIPCYWTENTTRTDLDSSNYYSVAASPFSWWSGF